MITLLLEEEEFNLLRKIVEQEYSAQIANFHETIPGTFALAEHLRNVV